MWADRAARARLLAGRYPASREVLLFYAELATWQGQASPRLVDFENVVAILPSLVDLIRRAGPAPLREAAEALDSSCWRELLQDYWAGRPVPSPLDFFARAALQPYASSTFAGGAVAEDMSQQCPRCAHAPQVAFLRPEGHGLALELVCSLCLGHWPFPRSRCPACGESAEGRLVYYSAPEFPHLRINACETCRAYLQAVDLGRDPLAIPEVDELAGLPLDLWAQQQGYHKIHPNLAGV